MIKKYRKKPIVVEAVQWKGDNPKDIEEFMGSCYTQKNAVMVRTLEGDMFASIGDWIIKGVLGEFYPCKPEHFKLTYDEVK